LENPTLTNKKLGMVACTCHPSYGEKHKQEDCSLGWLEQKHEILLKKITKEKRGWRHDSSGRAPD
jgi:hypothetical protein